jgi:curved DNA-binding protein CbpA
MSSPVPQSLPDYYRILGADPQDQLDQIEGLFRQLAMEAETSGDHTRVPAAIEAFKVLRDPNLRQQYDQQFFQSESPENATSNPVSQSEQPAQAIASSQPPAAEGFVASPVENTATETTTSSELSQRDQPEALESSQPPSAVEATEPPSPESLATPENKTTVEEELSFKPDLLESHRRELLRMFYEKRRKNMRASGMAIGGLDPLVCYSYELLEFHLWILSEKKWVVREESGALSISALGCEEHEKNLMAGLVTSNM